MKRFATIVSLGLLLFSLGGYRIFLGYMERASDKAFQTSIYDHMYDEAMLLHIKVAASTPYGSNSEQYENTTGEVDINGITYHFVKRRFYKDSLELWCLPNIDKIGIRNARDDFFRLAGDYNASSSTQKSSNQHTILKFTLLDFTEHHAFSWQFRNECSQRVRFGNHQDEYLFEYVSSFDHPPQA